MADKIENLFQVGRPYVIDMTPNIAPGIMKVTCSSMVQSFLEDLEVDGVRVITSWIKSDGRESWGIRIDSRIQDSHNLDKMAEKLSEMIDAYLLVVAAEEAEANDDENAVDADEDTELPVILVQLAPESE